MFFGKIHNSLYKLSEAWPDNLRNRFQVYIPDNNEDKLDSSNSQYFPFWYNIIMQLYENFSNLEVDKNIAKCFLEDLLWAQYCLILAYRIKDDLLDGDIKSNSLIIASDQLLIESSKTFGKYFNYSDSFWERYYDSIQRTTLAAMKVDEMQQNPKTIPSLLLMEYENVLSLFNIGIVAICKRYGKNNELQEILEANKSLSLAGQILDDLEDIHEDFSRGRFNYVLLDLMHHSSVLKYNDGFILDLALEKISQTNFFTNLFDFLLELISASQVNLSSINIMGLNELTKGYLEGVKKFKMEYRKRRIDLLLNKYSIKNE